MQFSPTGAQYKENETLYFQRVPPAIDLAPPAPALLVAAVPPPPELDQPEDKWFAFLGGAPAFHQRVIEVTEDFCLQPADNAGREPSAWFIKSAHTKAGL